MQLEPGVKTKKAVPGSQRNAVQNKGIWQNAEFKAEAFNLT